MNLSYWEYKTWFSNIDFTIIGSGIVGLNCALSLRDRFPDARILVVEKGALPLGASTRNAGFTCFGSVSEILSDLAHHSPAEVQDLVSQRWLGIKRLRKLLGDEKLRYQELGGHEVFFKEDAPLYNTCLKRLDEVNELVAPVFGKKPFEIRSNAFGFQGVMPNYISNPLEGQIDTGLMMKNLIDFALSRNIQIINGLEIDSFKEDRDGVTVSGKDFEFKTAKLFIATNGFAGSLLNEEVAPARAQVLITEKIPGLKIEGTFHLDKGYYYFRNVGDRILLGGGRNLDLKGEETADFGQTDRIQNRLEEILHQTILPGVPVKISSRWSGIMGVGTQKKPIVKQVSDHVFCGVRLGGMGVAIGSEVGEQLAALHN